MHDPVGKVTILYPKGNLTFKSNECNWLLTDNNTATLTGTGKINNHGNFGFLLIAKNSPDKLRIIIFDKDDGDNIVYDNLNPQSIHGAIVMYNRCFLSKEGDEEILTAPVEFTLEQNYPNPFNPTTTINYSIPEAGNVELKVYDVLGNEVANLVNQEMAPGNYTANFDASSLASGIYIYRLQTGSLMQTRKMILMK